VSCQNADYFIRFNATPSFCCPVPEGLEDNFTHTRDIAVDKERQNKCKDVRQAIDGRACLAHEIQDDHEKAATHGSANTTHSDQNRTASTSLLL
jgi:hypothetical protein